jgi:hypothetical protein
MRSGKITWGLVAVLVASVLVMAGLAAGCSESGKQTTLTVAIAERQVKQGDAYAVEVRIDTDTACRGAQFAMSFDPTLMRCDGVAEGSFFKNWAAANGATTLMRPDPVAIDNSQGQVPTVFIAVIGYAGGRGATGSGVLCTYYFTVLADGEVELTLSDVAVADESGREIPDVEVVN